LEFVHEEKAQVHQASGGGNFVPTPKKKAIKRKRAPWSRRPSELREKPSWAAAALVAACLNFLAGSWQGGGEDGRDDTHTEGRPTAACRAHRSVGVALQRVEVHTVPGTAPATCLRSSAGHKLGMSRCALNCGQPCESTVNGWKRPTNWT